MKTSFLTLWAALAAAPLLAIDVATVSSPDGQLVVTVSCQGGRPAYQLTYQGQTALHPAPLGLVTNVCDLTADLTLTDAQTSVIDEQYTLTRTKVSEVHYQANRLLCSLSDATGERQLQVEWRVSNNDVAMRYLLPRVGELGSLRVTAEATSYAFPEGTTTFLTPQSEAMIGWKRTKPSYEELYSWDAPLSQMSQFGHGYTFPCLFHLGGQPDGLWVLLSETGVDSHYCASHLSDVHQNPLADGAPTVDGVLNTFSIAYPMPEENNGIGNADAAIALPGVTPWRTITVGRTLQPIAETTAPWDNVRPLYATTHDYHPGRGTWSWILWQDPSINYDDLCRYVDLAKAMGYEYVLVDNWWDTNLPKREELRARNEQLKAEGKEPQKSIEDLIDYAHSQGIDVFLWYSSSGYWNDIVQGPISRMDNSIVRKREMRWMQELGVKGIKVDFFGGDKQETIRLYEQILSDADDHGLMVIFHGCTLPRGWERMFPNYMGSEAVLASENLIFGQQHCDLEARHATLHPVCRNAVGCMEFGGSFQNRYMNRDNRPAPDGRHVNHRLTTSTFSLATAILFQNPVQNFALAPNNLTDAPALSMDFMRQVPTTWDEVRFLDGYPGRYMVMARRHADTWYVAAINATDKPLRLTLDLSWLAASSLTLYAGGDAPTTTSVKPSRTGSVTLTLPSNDGAVIVTQPLSANHH